MRIQPLNLEAEAPPAPRLPFWPILDLCAIGLFFVFFGSKFVLPPVIPIELPQGGEIPASVSAVYDVLSVREIQGEEMILFQDRILNRESFRRLLEQRVEVGEDATLLVRADASTSTETLGALCSIASESGYRRLQLAAEPAERGFPEASPEAFGSPTP